MADNSFDAIVIGSGISGGWAAKELTEKGLKTMEVRAGDSFNVDFHEAITQIPAPSEDLKGKIVDVIETGYTLGDKVIRFAKVVTGS